MFQRKLASHGLSRTIYRSKSTVAAAQHSSSLPSFVLQAPETKITKLLNGIHVATETTLNQAASIKIFVKAGTRNAKPSAAQLFHQIMKQGTRNRSKEELETSIKKLGGSVNVNLDRECTVFAANVLKEDVAEALDVLSDMLQNPKLDASHLAQARLALMEKVQSDNCDVDQLVFDRLHETAYMDSALSYSLIAKEDDAAKAGLEDLEKYVKSYYVAPRIVIAGAGAIEHSQLVNLAEKCFQNLPITAAQPSVEQANFVGSDIRVKDDTLPFAHFALAFESFDSTSENYFNVKIMENLIGSWDNTSPAGRNASSKLAQAVAEHDLAKSFRAFSTCYSDTGLFGIHAIAGRYNLNDLAWYMTEALVRLVHKTNDEEVETARNLYRTSLLMDLDNICKSSDDIGRQVMANGHRFSLPEIMTLTDAVNAISIRKTADEIINDKEHALAAIGPIHELPDYTFIRRRSYWLRS